MKRRRLEVEGSPGQRRVATSAEVARYRARRLACDFLVEIGAGVGGQTLAFSRTCGKLVAVEKNAAAAARLRQNLASAGNVEVLEGDALSARLARAFEGAEAVFCDTERPLASRERSLDEVRPPIGELRARFANLAVEVPPQLDPARLPADAEKEYLSVGGRLARLTLYFGSLRRVGVAAVSLPAGERLDDSMPSREGYAMPAQAFLYEVDTAVLKAGLLGQLLAKFPSAGIYGAGKYVLLTARNRLKSPFLNPYRVLASVPADAVRIRAALKKFGRVVVHARMAPDDHRGFIKSVQKGLSGSRTAHLFIKEGECLITEQEQ